MARPLRLEFAGALYHVTSRGDRQADIYDDDVDRQAFLSVMASVCQSYNWICHAYCLMSNHYHLLVETPDANLSRGMRQLNINQRPDPDNVFLGEGENINGALAILNSSYGAFTFKQLDQRTIAEHALGRHKSRKP